MNKSVLGSVGCVALFLGVTWPAGGLIVLGFVLILGAVVAHVAEEVGS